MEGIQNKKRQNKKNKTVSFEKTHFTQKISPDFKFIWIDFFEDGAIFSPSLNNIGNNRMGCCSSYYSEEESLHMKTTTNVIVHIKNILITLGKL